MGTIEDDPESSIWFVPRRAMCALFWLANVLLFTGIILVITSIHKGVVYRAWGGVFLGVGFCALFTCFVLCIHAYCIITVDHPTNTYEKNVPPPAPLGPHRTTMTSSASQPNTLSTNKHLCDCANKTAPGPLSSFRGHNEYAPIGAHSDKDQFDTSTTPQSVRSNNYATYQPLQVVCDQTEIEINSQYSPIETKFDRQMELLSQGYHSTETDDPPIPEIAVTITTEDTETTPKSLPKNRTGIRLARQDRIVNKQEQLVLNQKLNTSQYDNIWSKDAEILHYDV